MGHGDGRPGTPGPGGGGGGDTKATYSGGVVLVAIISFVLGTIAVAVPYWGLFRPQTGDTSSVITIPYNNNCYHAIPPLMFHVNCQAKSRPFPCIF